MEDTKQDGEETQFIKRMDSQLLGWNEPAARLREALDYDHFRLYGQPVMVLAAPGGIAFAEVLLRLREEETRMLPPGDFLPAFQHYGMMAELDRWVLRNALRGLGAGGPLKAISVNVSTQTLQDTSFAAFAAVQLRLAGLEPAALVIEIDENDAVDNRAPAERFAAEMKAIGCRLLIDGFARRSVSFESLKALLVDFVKVDGSVVRNIMRSGAAAAKLKAVLRVGEVTGVGVIAECVEDEKILTSLKLLKTGYVQGFGVRQPVPLDDLFKT